ncbi:MAG: polyferredoxin [Paraglaciecola sp.]|jgi:polyferredoxin
MSNSTATHKTIVQKIGLGIFVIGFLIFTAILGLDSYKMTPDTLQVENNYHRIAISKAAEDEGFMKKEFPTNFAFINNLKSTIKVAQGNLQADFDKNGLPEGVSDKNSYLIADWKIKDYILPNVKKASIGPVASNPLMYWLLSIGLAIFGGLLYIIPKFRTIPGIRHDHIFHNALTRGLTSTPRSIALGLTIVGVLVYGFFYIGSNLLLPILTVAAAAIITGLVFFYQKHLKKNPPKSASPSMTAWLGIFVGIYLVLFYILLYWNPAYITGWMLISDPFSKALNGGEASQWFLYGMLYSIIVCVMGLRMIAKYRHNKYQMIRTGSVMFFQTAIAFLLPEILVRLNQPYFDFKNIWPLDYDFFFDWNINTLIESGGLGIFMFVWGIALIVLAVPIITYFYGKRWYCSWVCGCGGLAETLGDPYRQLSDKSLRAWEFERYIIHGVLVFAVLMTAMTLYTYFTGNYQVLGFNSDTVRNWYGFLIGAGFSGVVGTGFYPLMGNRVWCRFGCPLSAYLGLVQRFKSRFRITTNGSQCISCGNCSTYCEMGIDVRSYAQKGQDIVRSSCVGCGVCAAVCPRGVLRLENGGNVSERALELRTIHITEEQIRLLN